MSQVSFDDTVLRRIVIEELSEVEAKRLASFIAETRKRLIRRLDNLTDRNGMKARTVKAMLEQSNQIHNQLYAQMRDDYTAASRDFAKDQADWRKANLATATGEAIGLSSRQAIAAMSFNPALGREPSEWYKELADNHKRRVRSAIRQSFAEGDSVASATRRLRDTIDHNARGLRTFVRTSYSNIAANVDLATYKANNVSRYMWLSTLDSRTTPICSSRDGLEYKTGQGPLPPAHMNCRSTTYAVTPETKDLRKETYDQWLRRQPSETQNGIMGRARAQKYRDNPGLQVRKFVSRNGGWKKLDDIRPPKPRARKASNREADTLEGVTFSRFAQVQRIAQDQFKDAPDWARDLLLKLPNKEIEPITKGAYYTRGTQKVSISGTSLGAIRHEFGHAIDDLLGGGRGDYASFSPQTLPDFIKTRKRIYKMHKDGVDMSAHKRIYRALGLDPGVTPRGFTSEYFLDAYRDTLKAYPGDGFARQEAINFADMMGAISDNRVGFGHRNHYYKSRKRIKGFSEANTTEAFANWFHFMTGDKASQWDEIFEELIPEVHAAFKGKVGI